MHAIIHWLTGYDEQTLQQQIDKKVDFETFFARAPRINPNVSNLAYAASLLVIVVACVLAASVPALRAARVDPIATLRND